MTSRNRTASPGSTPALLTLTFCAVGFALAVALWLGLAGLTTSGFTLTVALRQAVPLIGFTAVGYFVLGAVLLALTVRRRRARTREVTERTLFHGMITVSLWVLLTLMFLPLKGAESFVRADTLTTFQLNVIGLAAVIVAGWLAGWILSKLLAGLLRLFRAKLSGAGMALLGGTLAVAVIAVLVIGSTVRARSASGFGGAAGSGPMPRVAVIGVDGCDWEKLGPLVRAGRLPTFKKLMDEGSYGPLMSAPPLISPRIWTSIATGKVPEKHGILDFVNEDGVPVNATMRSAAAVWEIVSAHGGPVGVVGWYVTWPVDPINGFLLSDRMHSLLRGPLQIAQSASGHPTNERLESFGRFTFDPGYKSYERSELAYQQNRIVDEPLRWGYLRDSIYTRLADVLLPTYRPAFSAVYLRGVDFVQHFFWKYSDPEPFGDVTPADIDAYGAVIENYYEYTDALLARLLEALGDDVNVLIVSDHGFKARLDADPGRPQLTGTHDITGVFIASGPDIAPIGRFEEATILDVTPTALAIMGLPVADDMDGRVLTEIIAAEHLEAHPVASVASYESLVGTDRGDLESSSMDESIREQLRSLGYIE